jgi:uncharacterized protein
VVTPARVPNVTSDPDDNIFIACADAARADYQLTGNQRHFPKFWKNTKVISSSEFLNVLAPHLIGAAIAIRGFGTSVHFRPAGYSS